jgi:hypothetical protein
MGVAVADKAATLGGFVDGGLEDPEVFCRTAEPQDGLGVNAGATVFLGDSEQIRVSDIPRLLDRLRFPRSNVRKTEFVQRHCSLRPAQAEARLSGLHRRTACARFPHEHSVSIAA